MLADTYVENVGCVAGILICLMNLRSGFWGGGEKMNLLNSGPSSIYGINVI